MTTEDEKNRIRERYKGGDTSTTIKIPAIPKPSIYDDTTERRVGVYARVSTDNLNQTSSYELQKNYYTDLIDKNPMWHLVDIYADEGISGTSLNHREEFKRMIADCRAGKLDLIITKNVATDTTKLHNKIVQILKYKKYKGAAVTDKNIAKFHGKCEDLLKKLKVIQQNINPEVENDYISVFPTFEFEDIIFKIDPSEKFSDMREFRHNRKNKLNDYILELEQEIKIEDDEYMYGDLLKQIEKIKPIIEKVFK